MNLDELLRESGPPVSPRTEALHDELNAVVLASEAAARPRRRGWRIGVASVVASAALVFGTAAGVIPAPEWLPWVTKSGNQCQMYFTVQPTVLPNGQTAGEPLTRAYTPAESAHAVAVAQAFLASYDFAGIDEAAAIREWQRKEDKAIAAQPDPAERQPRLTGDDLSIMAVGDVVWHDVRHHLEEQGIPTELVLSEQGWRCGE